MNVLVTGSNGFIGSHIADYFARQDLNVTGWDIVEKDNGEYYTIAVNLLDDNLQKRLESLAPDIIIHCAGCANVGDSIQDPFTDYAGNTTVVYRLLDALRLAGLKECKFVMLSSAAVYGQPKRLPIKETDKLQPMSPYALHKKMAEEICLYYTRYHGLQCRIARIFSAYGAGLRKQIFWDMYQKALTAGRLEMFGTGSESRDFIYIDDLVNALFLIATAQTKNIVFNVANGIEVKINQIAERFGECLGIKDINFNGIIREGDPNNWRADITKLKSLGYDQKVRLDNGIMEYICWVKSL